MAGRQRRPPNQDLCRAPAVPTGDGRLPVAFSSAYAVTKTRSRVSTGEEWPGGSGVFQTTFFAGPNTSGSPIETETPLPFGPRNCGQSSANAPVAANRIA